jgi:L-asparaginase/Glu-tRNA(Gln) amidotransferase subunit D
MGSNPIPSIMNWLSSSSGYLYSPDILSESDVVHLDFDQSPTVSYSSDEYGEQGIPELFGLFCGGTVSCWGSSAGGVSPDECKTSQYMSTLIRNCKLGISLRMKKCISKLSEDYSEVDFEKIRVSVLELDKDFSFILTGTDRICELAAYLRVKGVGADQVVLVIGTMKSPARPGCELPHFLKFMSLLVKDGGVVLPAGVWVLSADAAGVVSVHYPQWVYKSSTYCRGSLKSKMNYILLDYKPDSGIIHLCKKPEQISLKWELRSEPVQVIVVDDRFTDYSLMSELRCKFIIIRGTGVGNIGAHNLPVLKELCEYNRVVVTTVCPDGPIRTDIYKSTRIISTCHKLEFNRRNYTDSFLYYAIRYTTFDNEI